MVLLVPILFVCVITYFFYSIRRYHIFGKYIDKFQGPRTLPIFGNLLQLGIRPHEHLHYVRQFCHKYNYEMFRLYAGNQPYVCLSNPKDIEVVLSSTQLLYKDDIYNFLHPWLGYGLLTSFGSRWQKHRKMITPSFHFQILQDFLYGMNETTDKFIELLRTTAKNDKIFDIQPLVVRSTIDVICDTAMGVQTNSISGKDGNIVTAINVMCHVVEERVFSVIKRSEFLFRFTSMYRMQKQALAVLRKELSKIIEKRKRIISENRLHEQSGDTTFKRPKLAFLDNLITAEIDGRPLTFEDIFEEVSTFIFEGHDTTASAIIFTLYCLSRKPEIQEKAFLEQREILGDNCSSHPTYQDLLNMKYLEKVIKEALRLFPAVPIIARTTTELTEINGHQIPPSTTILMLLIGLGYDEKNFKNPLEFNPERFNTNIRDKSHPFDYLPFSAGPRNCIGQKFAMMELKCTVSKIVRNFEILPPIDGMPMYLHNPSVTNDVPNNKYDPLMAALIVLKSETGVWIRLRERTQNCF